MPEWPVTIAIEACRYWNETGIPLELGGFYAFTAEGIWRDLRNACPPEGIESPSLFLRATEGVRRAPAERWFTLMGAIGKDRRSIFRIGAGTRWQAPRDGSLCCFANDVPGFYFNNSGSVRLTVRREA